MNRIWTKTVPRRLIGQAPARTTDTVSSSRRKAGGGSLLNKANALLGKFRGRTVVSGRSLAPGTRPRLVQLATFGERANAVALVTRLRAAGFPARTATYERDGRALVVVMAGPFAAEGAARAVLDWAERAGFGDAFVRR